MRKVFLIFIMKHVLVTLFISILFFVASSLMSQTFELEISSLDMDEVAYDALQLEDQSYVILGQQGVDYDSAHPYILLYHLNYTGQVIQSKRFEVDSSYLLRTVQNIFAVSQGNYLILGNVFEQSSGEVTQYLCNVNSDFDILSENIAMTIPSVSDVASDYIINTEGNVVAVGMINDFFYDYVFVKEFSFTGEVLKKKEYEWNTFYMSSLVEYPARNSYYVTTLIPNAAVIEIDKSDLEILESTSLPLKFTAIKAKKHFAGDEFLIVGKKQILPTQNTKLSFLTCNESLQLSDNYNYGQPDTNCLYQRECVDFINDSVIYLAGTHNFAPSPPFLFPEPRWIFMNKLKTDGTIIWQRFYKGELNYMPYKVLATSDGGALILSHKYDWNKPDNKRDIHILKIDSTGWYEGLPPVGTGEFEQQKQILAYPNPTRDWVHFEPGLYNDLQLTLYDQNGRELLSRPISSGTSINLSEFPAGVYIYVIQNQKGFLEKGKVVKE